jgi:Double-GTPase 2
MWNLAGAILIAALLVIAITFLVALTAFVALLAAVAVAVFTTGFVAVAVQRAGVGVLRDTGQGHLRVAPPDPAPLGRDPGYLSYYFGPAWQDCADVLKRGAAEVRNRTIALNRKERRSVLAYLLDTWRLPDELQSWPGMVSKVIFTGGLVGGIAGLAVGAVVAGTVLGITAVVFIVLLGALIGVTLAVCGVLRLFELGTLRLRGITVECPSCHRRVGVPVYECPTCQELHRRLAPGSLGVLVRTCRCRTELPTLLVRGRSRLRAHCSHLNCQGVLPIGGLSAPTHHVPVVAGKVAGKTVHTMAAIADLLQDDGFAFGDDHTAAAYAEIETQLRDVTTVPSTLPSAPLRAATFFVGTGSSRRLVYVYDAAGEHYQSSDKVSGLRFLGSTAGMLLVVDPFSLTTVRTRMEAEDIPLPPHSTSPPDDVVSRIADGLREQAVGRRRNRIDVRVAVVVTKCDVLVDRGPVPHPYESVNNDGRAARSTAVARWLDNVAGEGGLVRQLANQYTEIAYFAVSALDAFGTAPRANTRTGRDVENDPPSAPLRWLLAKRPDAA